MISEIENSYQNYKDLSAYFGEKVIEGRIEQLYEEMNTFLSDHELTDIAYVNDVALTHALMDYFSDIRRQKEYQHVEHIAETGIKAFESYWILKRKPIQLKKQLSDDTWLYINEKFVLVRLTSFLLANDLMVPLVGERRIAFENFMNTFYYQMKFHTPSAQSIELILMSFIAGRHF